METATPRNPQEQLTNSRRARNYNIFRPRKNPEVIARQRTSEFMLQLLAGYAVRFAINNNTRRENTDPKVKSAELRRMQSLWQRYTRQQIHSVN